MDKVIHDEIQALYDEVVALRRDFHQHPELGFQERRTSAKVEEYLNELGIPTQRCADTGVVGLIEGAKPGKTLLLRADMDALPIQEESGLPFASENPGVMHACGHDGHTAMLMVAAKVLMQHRDELAGNVKLVFQPNEESDGASFMIKEGVLDNPKVDASFATHLWTPLPTGTIGLQAGPVMGEMFIFKVSLTGVGGHSSAPQDGIDPVLCAAAVIQGVQAMQTREISSLDPTTIVFGKIVSDGANNIISTKVEMEGTLRYLYDGDDDTPQHPKKRFRRIIEGICAAYNVGCEIELIPSNYTVINSEDSVTFLKEQVMPELDAKNIQPYCCMAGEDFSEFTNRAGVPGALVFIGTGNPDVGSHHAHHTAQFTIDESTLLEGIRLHVFSALKFLQA